MYREKIAVRTLLRGWGWKRGQNNGNGYCYFIYDI